MEEAMQILKYLIADTELLLKLEANVALFHGNN